MLASVRGEERRNTAAAAEQLRRRPPRAQPEPAPRPAAADLTSGCGRHLECSRAQMLA